MYDFRSKTPQAPEPGRFNQRRLIYLVVGLALVLYAMWHAKNPRNWRWFEALTERRTAEVDTAAPARPTGKEFADGDLPDDDLPGRIVLTEKRQAEKPDANQPLAERVNRELLKSVEDNVAGFDPRESDAHYHLLEILAEAGPETIRAAEAEPVSHLQLWEQSEAYRGKLVSMRGEVKLVAPRTFPQNEYGLSTYYEVWMLPQGTTNPVVVRALELPADFPVGDKLSEPVSVTGFYYRRWWYMATDKDRLAPMLLARSLEWSPRPAAVDAPADASRIELVWWIGAGVVTLGVLGMLFMRRYSRGQPPDYIRSRQKQGDLSDIPGDAGPRDTAAELRQLSQSDEAGLGEREP